VASAGKGHELAAVKLLLGQLPLEGRVITADGLATQREVCEIVKDGKGDYLLPVKENQGALLADIKEAFSPSAVAEPGRTDCTAEG
jgi:predicted transposase YbfD/YdcC